MNIIDFKGQIAALLGAFLWATSAIVYTSIGAKIPPLILNLWKGAIALLFIGITLIITNHQFSPFNVTAIMGLITSGIIGIGIGDTAYFKALNNMGARKTLLLETLAPPITAILAFIFIGERLKITIWIGIFITILGVAWVISERNTETSSQSSSTKIGLYWALIGVLSQGMGAVIARSVLSTTNITALESTLIRLIGGTIILLLIMTWQRQPLFSGKFYQILSPKLALIIIITAFMSTYLGIWLQQTAFKFSPAGIAQTLLATSPLFVLPLVAFLGERISYRAILGAMIALIGVFILF